jgi:hypothetical protein
MVRLVRAQQHNALMQSDNDMHTWLVVNDSISESTRLWYSWRNCKCVWTGPDQARPVPDCQSGARSSPTFRLDRTGLSAIPDRVRPDWWNHWNFIMCCMKSCFAYGCVAITCAYAWRNAVMHDAVNCASLTYLLRFVLERILMQYLYAHFHTTPYLAQYWFPFTFWSCKLIRCLH